MPGWADAIDSFYRFVKANVIAINADRIFVGIMNAQDWPPKNLTLEAYYLLVLGEEPIGKQGYSQAVPIKFHLVQWVWLIKGSDLQQGTRAAFRGDRYRTMQSMKDEMTQGMYPGYSPKLTWALNPATGAVVGTPFTPPLTIAWPPVTFHEKFDKESGVAYGTASTRIQDFYPTITTP
jgi:hypothetical protein